MTLPEVVIVLVMVGLVATVVVTYGLPWLGREAMRGAVYTVQTRLQTARIQAVTRNRSCRFVVDSASGRLQVYDLNDPSSALDDILVDEASLPASVTFGLPDGGTAITIAALTGTLYQATFASDGSVSAGAGAIGLMGGEGYARVLLYGAGGIRTERWNGAAWQLGT